MAIIKYGLADFGGSPPPTAPGIVNLFNVDYIEASLDVNGRPVTMIMFTDGRVLYVKESLDDLRRDIVEGQDSVTGDSGDSTLDGDGNRITIHY